MQVKNIALGLVVACVAQASQCEQSAAEGKVLLQASTRARNLQRGAVVSEGTAAATDLMYTQVSAMASDIMEAKREPSAEEMKWLDSIQSYIEQNQTTAMMKGHKDDQALMDNAVADLVECETVLQTDTASVASKKQGATQLGDDHALCRSDESALETDASSKWSALTGVYDNLQAPQAPNFSFDLTGDNYLAKIKEFSSKMDSFLAESKEFAKAVNQSYTTAKNAYEKAAAALLQKQFTCNETQIAFESSFCHWADEARSAGDKHEQCWGRGTRSFDVTKSTVLDSAEQRKHEYSAVQKILCFLQMLRERQQSVANNVSADSKADDCTNMTVDDSFLDVVNTAAPDKGTADFGDLTLQPGVDAWSQQQYGSFASNAPAAPAMACL
eukprot:gb/GFBE01020355.1/.p1 GENE.gb/GFBE01020355.1/~~gb/GFBE01020355.1/.p1  ORF type:complete len:386 (+),score=117.97 gb/GFBE01020355.1/:1-1158(+)